MAGDFNKPTGSSLKTAFMQEIRDIIADVAKMLYSGTANPPDGLVRRNSSTKKFEVYTLATTSWGPLDISETTIALAANSTTCGGKTPAAASGLATLNSSSKVVQDPASKAAASGIASLDANTRLVQAAVTVWDGTAARSLSPLPGANAIPVREASGHIAGGPGILGRISSTASTLDCGTVTNGDVIFVQWQIDASLASGSAEIDVALNKNAGTATIQTYTTRGGSYALTGPTVKIDSTVRGSNKASHTITGVIFVTGSGTLTLGYLGAVYGTSPTYSNQQWNAWFLKKQ